MWIVWSALAVLAIALFLYRSSLMKDEEDQIFLDDCSTMSEWRRPTLWQESTGFNLRCTWRWVW